ATFAVDIGATADAFNQTAGVVDLTGATLTLNQIALVPVGTSFTIITGPSVTGTFKNAPVSGSFIFSAGGLDTAFSVTYNPGSVVLTCLRTEVWQGLFNSNWSTAGNWLSGVAPVSGDVLVFDTTLPSFIPGPTGFHSLNDIAGLTGISLFFKDASFTDDF